MAQIVPNYLAFAVETRQGHETKRLMDDAMSCTKSLSSR